MKKQNKWTCGFEQKHVYELEFDQKQNDYFINLDYYCHVVILIGSY